MDRVGGDVPGEVVGRPVDMATADATAGEPPRISPAEVIASLRIGRIPLAEGRATELPPPGDERVVEEPALLEVEDQRRRRPLGVTALLLELREEVAVLIPAGVHELHEPGASFEESACDQAVGGEAPLHMDIGPVAIEDALRLGGEVCQVRDARLHPKGHLVLRDPCVDLRIAIVGKMRRIHRCDVVEQRAPRRPADARRVGQIGNRVASVAEPHPLVTARQESAPPVVVEKQLPAGLRLVGGGHDHKRRQLVSVATQAIGEPGPHARPARHLRSGHEQRHPRGMVDRLGVHAADDANLIGDPADVRQHLGELDPGVAVAFEGLDGRLDRPLRVAAGHRREPRRAADTLGDVLAGKLAHHRLGVVEIDVRRPPSLPEHDNPLRLRRMMGEIREPGDHRPGRGPLPAKQRCQSHAADPHAGRSEQAPARDTGHVLGDGGREIGARGETGGVRITHG